MVISLKKRRISLHVNLGVMISLHLMDGSVAGKKRHAVVFKKEHGEKQTADHAAFNDFEEKDLPDLQCRQTALFF